ncbi:hypothetical protein ASD65_13085 [Microbacterium sp. Root61]|uniref:ABC transporter substrate-binding protein n=1 Tax=Microbacterium sp. Root61 TaxID=1736570 RepID=UPI0006F9647F|nr:ABC transporter substrate-binding protein [Microbacterium sp. Root61]KRA25252.1 hypothetical protein ASD65_13085 [Microbacterium sp. Root61]
MGLTNKGVPALGLALLLTTLAGCASSGAPTGDPTPAPTSGDDHCTTTLAGDKVVLTVSTLIEGFAPLVIAMQSGAFEEAGLDVSVEKISAADSLAQIGQGRLDGQLTSYSVGNMNAVASGVDMLWVAPFYELPSADSGQPLPGYWARTDLVGTGAKPDLAGLEGQTIASPTGGTGAGGMVLDKALESEGLSIDDVAFTTASGGDALIALENGAVGGAWLSAPFNQTAASNPDLRLAATYATGINGSGIIIGPSLIERPEVLVKLLQVLAETNEKYLQGDYHDNAEAVAYLAKGLEQSEESIKAGVPFIFDPTLDMTDAATYVDDLQEFMRRTGGLDYAENLAPDKLIAAEFAAKAASCLG